MKKFALEVIIQVARSLGTKYLVDTNKIFSQKVCRLHSLTLTLSQLIIIPSVFSTDSDELSKDSKTLAGIREFEGIDWRRLKIISVGRAWEICSVKAQFGLISQW